MNTNTLLRLAACAVLMLVISGFAIVPAANADLRPMQVVWNENFEDGPTALHRLAAQGWVIEKYTRSDKIAIVPDEDNGDLSVHQGNWVLKGESCSKLGGAGFHVRTPSYAQMNIDPDEPYAIRFDYWPEFDCCGTYALASRHASLTVTDCGLVPGMVMVYLMDDITRNTIFLGRIPKERWTRVDVLVVPDPLRDTADLRIRLGGVLVGDVQDWPAMMSRDRIQMLDLPFAISDGTVPAGQGCFGSGRWDEVALMKQIPDTPTRPRGLDLHLAPNPFNPRTELSFVLPTSETARVMVYDVAGRLVRSLIDERLEAGAHTVVWDGKDAQQADVASGVYLISVAIGSNTDLVRAVLVR